MHGLDPAEARLPYRAVKHAENHVGRLEQPLLGGPVQLEIAESHLGHSSASKATPRPISDYLLHGVPGLHETFGFPEDLPGRAPQQIEAAGTAIRVDEYGDHPSRSVCKDTAFDTPELDRDVSDDIGPRLPLLR